MDTDTVIAVDISERTKCYAKQMEHLCWVRDGSDSEGSLKRGYWLLEAVGINRAAKERFPLLSWLYSSVADGFASESRVVVAGFQHLREAFGNMGIYTFDRGGDRENIIKPLLGAGFRLVIRVIGTRNIMLIKGKKEKKLNLLKAARNLCSHSYWRLSENGGTSKIYKLNPHTVIAESICHPNCRMRVSPPVRV